MNKNVANRECIDVVLVNYATKKPFLNIDFANVTTTDMTANRVYARGGQGAPIRVVFDGEKTGTMKLDTQITPMKLFAMLAGSDITSVAEVLKREEVTLTGGKLTVARAPLPGSVYVYPYEDDCGEAEEITVAGEEITLTGGTDGDTYIVYYLMEKTSGVSTVNFNSKKFPRDYIVYGETVYKDEEGGDPLPMLLKAYKASPQTAFSLALSNTGDPSTLSITFDLMADKNGDMLDMNLIEEDD